MGVLWRDHVGLFFQETVAISAPKEHPRVRSIRPESLSEADANPLRQPSLEQQTENNEIRAIPPSPRQPPLARLDRPSIPLKPASLPLLLIISA